MARVSYDGMIKAISGRFSGKGKYSDAIGVVRRDGTHYVYFKAYRKRDHFSVRQLIQHQAFALAVKECGEEWKTGGRRKYWARVARKSRGRYKTARGACFAYYYRLIYNELIGEGSPVSESVERDAVERYESCYCDMTECNVVIDKELDYDMRC